jgi:RNA polymerase sigma factor (sigma-70 family)
MSKESTFQAELMPYLDDAYNFAYYLTKRNEEDAKDLVQEAYMKAYKAFDNYQPGSNGKAWIFRILKNTFINGYRQKDKKPVPTDFSDAAERANLEAAGAFDLRTEVFDQHLGDEITTALQALSEDYRMTLLLCDIEGFSYEEIAGILSIPIGTVRSRLFRARAALKESLMQYARQQGFAVGM